MDPMQAEALRRVQEMQGKIPPQKKGESFTSSEQRREKPANRAQAEDKQSCPAPPPITCDNQTAAEGTLFADKEKLLILSLILILLSEENSDPLLTIALLYLII